MSENTKIEWCDHTFNPWEGCQKVGPGCDHCYAETRNARYAGGQAINWGPGAPRRRTSFGNWKKPLLWNAQAETFQAQHGRRQRVFCASLADVFDNEVPAEWREDLFDLILHTPHLDWLLLTKRIGNVQAMLPPTVNAFSAGFPNVWIGATVVNQVEADRDIPKLLAVSAAKRFLSIEPLLGPVDLRLKREQPCTMCVSWNCELHGKPDDPPCLRRVDWVIVGGESGPGARPMHPSWALSLRDQCLAAGVPFLFKQWGEWLPICEQEEGFTNLLYRSNRKAKQYEDQSAIDDSYGRTCTVPYGVVHMDGSLHQPLEPMAFGVGTSAMSTFKVGKKAAGRHLGGQEWNGYP